jgi:hypothetical protein
MRELRCHQPNCGSTDLILREAFLSYGEYDEGLLINDAGHIEARGESILSNGSIQPQMTEIECRSCGHAWHPRRTFDGAQSQEGRP